MSAIDGFLSRLDRVKQTGQNRWVACCPGHDDHNPSLAIRETEDGTVVIFCRAGCGSADVLASVGMNFSDLFPKNDPDYARIEKRGTSRVNKPFYASDILRVIGDEALIVATAAANIAHGMELSDDDRERLMLASERIQRAVSYPEPIKTPRGDHATA